MAHSRPSTSAWGASAGAVYSPLLKGGGRSAAFCAVIRSSELPLEVTDWLECFARTVLEAQGNTIKRVDFYVAKAKFYERLRDRFNERQAKVIARMFPEGVDGFKGGLSAENYITIAQTSRAAATRDLQDLVEKGALVRTGEWRHTRYSLALE